MTEIFKTRYISIAICLLGQYTVSGQNAHKNLRNGDMLYEYGKYQEAETEYRKAEHHKPDVKSAYNLSNTLVNQERYDEAAKKYTEAATRTTTDEQKAKIYYNQGNALFKKQAYKESIDAYKKSLRSIPDDQSAKENLAIARNELKKQIQQQKKEEQKKEQEDKKDKDQDQQNQKNDA
ncbi:MAG: tetratricopeptide repeat protein, partial [Saprospiraceae bacterium]|nr:tetratricopeptide repeat protein [Saprospiraceae bacterium]